MPSPDDPPFWTRNQPATLGAPSVPASVRRPTCVIARLPRSHAKHTVIIDFEAKRSLCQAPGCKQSLDPASVLGGAHEDSLTIHRYRVTGCKAARCRWLISFHPTNSLNELFQHLPVRARNMRGQGTASRALTTPVSNPGHIRLKRLLRASLDRGFGVAALISETTRFMPSLSNFRACQSDSGPDRSVVSMSIQSGVTRANARCFASAPDSNINQGACWLTLVTHTIPKSVSFRAAPISSRQRFPLPIASSDIHGSTACTMRHSQLASSQAMVRLGSPLHEMKTFTCPSSPCACGGYRDGSA